MLVKMPTVGAILAATVIIAHAQQNGTDRGKYEYEVHCAVCHGVSGKGDGPLAAQLKPGTVVPNLTELSTRNNGIFPFMRVYEIIDGRESVSPHGTKKMPVWGPLYNLEARDSAYDDFRADYEAFVHARILALTEYVYRLQTK